MKKNIHIIGAGLAGLAAAIKLQNENVTVYEIAEHAGGRCFSYHDKPLNCEINNGSHLILGCNKSVLEYIKLIKSEELFEPILPANYDFFDVKTKERWALKKLPRVSFLESIKLLLAKKHHTIDDIFNQNTEDYKKFIKPFAISALNTSPDKASAIMLRKVVLKMAFCRNGFVPYIAKKPLSKCLVEPALKYIPNIKYNTKLTALQHNENTITKLIFSNNEIPLTKNDIVILAVPAYVASKLLPEMQFPNEFSSIINLHFAYDTKKITQKMMGLIGGISEWIFINDGVISVTISAADHLLKEDIKQIVWDEIQEALGIKADIPQCKIIKDKRSTFLATPENIARRPSQKTQYKNLFLAGNFVDTQIPATLESAIKSGFDVAKKIYM